MLLRGKVRVTSHNDDGSVKESVVLNPNDGLYGVDIAEGVFKVDMRNSAEDMSQRMLNSLEPGTEMAIHRHKGSSETCICIRGHFEDYFYDDIGNLTDTIDMVPGGTILGIEKGQWHSLRCLESGTVLFEAKDGAYWPQGEDEIMKG